MMSDPNGSRRSIQFWVAIMAVGGIVLMSIGLIAAVTSLAIFGAEGQRESDTLNNAVLLAVGGVVGLAGPIAGGLFGRGAQGEPIPSPTVRVTTPLPGGGTTTTETGGSPQ